jgi:hypothetical protein
LSEVYESLLLLLVQGDVQNAHGLAHTYMYVL